MTLAKENTSRIEELRAVFLSMGERGQDSALAILKALAYAQLVMCIPQNGQTPRADDMV